MPLTGAPMPHAGAPPAVAYSPQMANVSPRKFKSHEGKTNLLLTMMI